MEYDVVDEVANRLDKLEILHQELKSEHQLLYGTTDEIATSVRKELEELFLPEDWDSQEFCDITNSIGSYSKREVHCYHGILSTTKILEIPILNYHP